MSVRVVFCEECRDEVSHTVEEKEMTGTIRGVQSVSYTHLTLPTTARRCRSRWSPYH